MRRITFLGFIMILGLVGCEEELPSTRVDYSLNQILVACNFTYQADFRWLDEFVDKAEAQPGGYYAVELMKYNSSVYIMLRDNLSASPPQIYNCNGDLALADLGLTYNEFIDQATKLKTIYSK